MQQRKSCTYIYDLRDLSMTILHVKVLEFTKKLTLDSMGISSY